MSLSLSCRAVALVVALIAAGCARSSAAEPPLVPLRPPPEPAAADAAGLDDGEPSPQPPASGDVCDIARDRELAGDLARWPQYRDPLAEALGPDHDVDQVLALLAPDVALTVAGLAAMELVWTRLHERCDGDPHTRLCQDLLFYLLADPLGRGAAGQDPAEVELAFDLAEANLRDLVVAAAADADVAGALQAHLDVVVGAREAFAAAGWGPDGVAGLEPLAADLMALGEVEVTEPLGYLQGSCGLW